MPYYYPIETRSYEDARLIDAMDGGVVQWPDGVREDGEALIKDLWRAQKDCAELSRLNPQFRIIYDRQLEVVRNEIERKAGELLKLQRV